MKAEKSQQNTGQQKVCVWVLASGPHDRIDVAVLRAPKADKIVAADGGTALADRLGLTPDLIVGDIDSSPSALVKEFEAAGVEIRRFDHDTKWETDTELAVLAALEYSPDTIVLLGALGGRLDHALANILLLTRPEFVPLDMRVVDAHHEVFLAKPGKWNDIRGEVGDTVTLLPAGVDVVGVSTRGLHWPLDGETLPHGYGRGVSNRIDAPGASVRLDNGLLLVVTVHA